MNEAKALKLKLIDTIENKENLGNLAIMEINDLHSKIEFHAKLSGNEELFYKELEEVK